MRPAREDARTCRFGTGLALVLSPPASLAESRVKGNEHVTGGRALSSAPGRRTRSLRRDRRVCVRDPTGVPTHCRRGAMVSAVLAGRPAAPAIPRTTAVLRQRGSGPTGLAQERGVGAEPGNATANAGGMTAGRGRKGRETGDDLRLASLAIPPIWEDGFAGRAPIDFAGRRIGRVAVRSGGRGRNMHSGIVVGQCGVRRGPAATRRRSAAA